MPDRRVHRGPHPQDAKLFAQAHHAALRAAVADLSWLLTRGYAQPSASKIVGDHHLLDARQRTAVMRCACSDQSLESRKSREVSAEALDRATLLIDGYNILTTVEAALAGGVLIVGRDGCIRDMASMHGSFRRVEETRPAAELIGRTLHELRVARSVWYLDSPVSNSGRLKTILAEISGANRWNWQVEIVQNPDAVLAATPEIIATADSVILDRCQRWFNLAPRVLAAALPAGSAIIELRDARN